MTDSVQKPVLGVLRKRASFEAFLGHVPETPYKTSAQEETATEASLGHVPQTPIKLV